MIVRIADESSSTERMPWLTLGLVAAILASFFLARGQQPFNGDGELVKLEHAVDYWLERPYLEPEPAVIDAAAHAAGSTDAAAFVAGARERGPAPPPDAEALEQEIAREADKLQLPPSTVLELALAPKDIVQLKCAPEEGFVLSRINGMYTVAQVLTLVPGAKLYNQLILHNLLQRGVIKLRESQEVVKHPGMRRPKKS